MGYGYIGAQNGPFTLLDGEDFPAVLAHAESQAAANGSSEFGLEVPVVNQAAVDYLLGRKYKIHCMVTILMDDDQIANYENYILTSPPFFL